MTQTPGRLFGFCLGVVAFLGPLAIHVYLPVIPAVKAAFGLPDALAQLTFSIAVFGMGASTPAYGTLADRHGRRPVLLSGLTLFLVGSVMSAAATSVPLLVLGRLVQAVGAGCGVTLVRTIAEPSARRARSGSPEHHGTPGDRASAGPSPEQREVLVVV